MSNDIVWNNCHITKEKRSKQKNQKPFIVWFTGLSGSGKSTLANALDTKLYESNFHTYLLDGDNIRCGLNKDLDFSKKSRTENIRRIGEISKLLVDSGLIVLVATISPFIKDRAFARELVDDDEFVEIFVDTALSICEKRDTKGLYKKARNNEIQEFTGISSSYEKSINAEIHIKESSSIESNVNNIMSYLVTNKYLYF